MITAQQIKERLNDEKDPLQYIDGEIARCASQMGSSCENVQDTISTYNHRLDNDNQIDIKKIKEELMIIVEQYQEINLFLKARKEQVKHLKRTEQLNKALDKRQNLIEQKNKKAPNE